MWRCFMNEWGVPLKNGVCLQHNEALWKLRSNKQAFRSYRSCKRLERQLFMKLFPNKTHRKTWQHT